MNNPFSLSGKTVLVTGASSGIGRHVAIRLSQLGVKLFLLGRNVNRLELTLEKLGSGEHQFLVGDINDIETMEHLIHDLPVLDGIVHAAGVLKISPVKSLESDDIMEMLKTNYVSPFNMMRVLLNNRKVANNASIVFITSINGSFTNVKGFSSYGASKAALSSAVKSLALEYAHKGIRFNSVAPGMIKTEMYYEMAKSISQEKLDADKKRYPLSDYGEPEDVTNACIYLLSSASKWVTGTSLIVDGGLTIT